MNRSNAHAATIDDPRLHAARIVVRECFWGDYDLTAEAILDKLDANDTEFQRFLFGRIADNATYPSRLIRLLFPDDVSQTLLQSSVTQPRWSDLRHRLIRANLTGDLTLVPERSWRS